MKSCDTCPKAPRVFAGEDNCVGCAIVDRIASDVAKKLPTPDSRELIFCDHCQSMQYINTKWYIACHCKY